MTYEDLGPSVGGGIVSDIAGMVAYTAEDCMEACAELNMFDDQWNHGVRCLGITWCRTLSYAWNLQEANCWLNTGSAVNPGTSDVNLSAFVVQPNQKMA